LTFGIPLEYDAELLGAPTATEKAFRRASGGRLTSADSLGGVDPINDNILYGFTHPEYWDSANQNARFPFSNSTGDDGTTGGKHPQ